MTDSAADATSDDPRGGWFLRSMKWLADRPLGWWTAIFVICFVGLVWSIVSILSSDYYPARFIDPERTRLFASGEESGILRVAVLQTPGRPQLQIEVGVAGALATVEIDWNPARTDRESSPEDTVIIDVELPFVNGVTVLDRRWGRLEGMHVPRGDAPPDVVEGASRWR